MRMTRLVRISVPLVMLGLAGFVLGCSGDSGSMPPPDKAASKKIAEEMKRDHLTQKAARAEAAKDKMRGGGR